MIACIVGNILCTQMLSTWKGAKRNIWSETRELYCQDCTGTGCYGLLEVTPLKCVVYFMKAT